MAYTINRYNGAQITVVADGTIDTTLDVKLIGKNYAGYGEIQNEPTKIYLQSVTAPPPYWVTDTTLGDVKINYSS